MSVYARFKKTPEGFRELVELLETTPLSRRKKMIDIGMLEDPEYTELALKYVFDFQDIVSLPDVQLAEVVAKTPARTIAYALQGQPEEIKKKILNNTPPQIGAEVRDYVNTAIGPREVGGAQMKIISIARELERKGLVRIKIIPYAV